MNKIPSFKLYKVQSEISLENIVNDIILENIEPRDDDPQTTRNFLESAKNTHKDLKFEYKNGKDIIKIKFEELMQFSDNQKLWLQQEKSMIKFNDFLIIGKSSYKIERLLQLYMRNNIEIKPLRFSRKYLWRLWSKLRKIAITNDLEIYLHRVILANTFLNSEEINEINIHAVDVNTLMSVREIIDQAETVKVITIKIFGLTKGGKVMTIRLDRNGSILIYGTHKNETIRNFMKLLSVSM